VELLTRVNRRESQPAKTFGAHRVARKNLIPSTIVCEFSSDMRNTRPVPLGPEGNNAPTLQQLMDTVKALKDNEQYKREQEWIKQEAKAE